MASRVLAVNEGRQFRVLVTSPYCFLSESSDTPLIDLLSIVVFG